MTRSLYRSVAAALLTAASMAFAGPASGQYAPVLTSQSPRSISGIRFRFMADGPVRGGFALASGKLLFGTESGTVYALDGKSGQLIWRRSLHSPVLSTPAIVGGRAYLTTWDNALHALDVRTGRELARYDLGRTLGPNDYWEYYVSSPVLSGGRLYVGSGSGRVYAIEPGSGRIAWSTDLGTRVRTTPLVTADKVIVGTMSGHLFALDRRDGHQLWKFATVGAAQDFAFKHNDTRSVVTQPIAVGDVVVAGGRDGNIYGVDLRTGAGRWRETHDGGSWILGLASDGKTFYSGSGSAFIVQAADAASGKEVWRVPTGNAMFGGLAKAGDMLVSNGINGVLLGLDKDTGAQRWSFRMPDMTLSSPLVAPGVIYTGSDDGSVYAIDTSTAAAPKLDPYVFSFTNEPPQSAFWLKPEQWAGIRGSFSRSGFAGLGNTELETALAAPTSGKGRKIIVIADARLPPGVDGAKLRRFLDGGGVLVLLGPDPLIYGFAADGSPETINEGKAKAAFGIGPSDKERDNGYNVAAFTPAAAQLGLTGTMVAGPAGTPGWVRPDQVSTVLALDRSGMATAWIKKFGNGGLLIDLPLPRNRTVEVEPYVDAIDLAVIRNDGR